MAKTIYTYLNNDDLNGSRIVYMDNCFCKLFKILRTDSDFLQKFKEDLQKPALYILLNRNERKAYIGETDTFFTRIQNHLAKKDFWEEVLAFTATDDSLSKTEVQYLEHLAYYKAFKMNVFDLSENTQAPNIPHMTIFQKGKTEEFFKYVQFLAKFVECNIFENNHQIHKEAPIVHTPLITSLSVKPEELQGRLAFKLNGVKYKTKGMMGYAIVKEFLKSHPKTTFEELRNTFHNDLLGSWRAWNFIENNIDYAINLKIKDGQARHLLKDEYILISGDGVRFVVSNQWEKGNVPNILQIAKNEGWDYEIIK